MSQIICTRPNEEMLDEFKSTFRQKEKARIVLSAIVEEEGRTCVRFSGTFVAMR